MKVQTDVSVNPEKGNSTKPLLGAVPVHKFPYNWNLKDAVFTKDKGKVFSCFACGGGSTMGYKLAGFDVLGCNEIDPKMIEAYKANHNPKYAYLEPIQAFKLRTDLPDELYNLDILDGSPPCSSFSIAKAIKERKQLLASKDNPERLEYLTNKIMEVNGGIL